MALRQPAYPLPDPAPRLVPGADGLVVGPDGLPARVVKAHNAHKAHYITSYSHTVAKAMQHKWRYRCYLDLYSGPGWCWVDDTGEFVLGSPLIAAGAEPGFTHHTFVDMDSRCVAALRARLPAASATILCADSNADTTLELVRASIPRRGALSLALLDPQGCTLHLDTIRKLTYDRPMDLLINLPIHSLYRCLAARYWHILDAVLGEDWPRSAAGGVPGWRMAVREHYQAKLEELGYPHSSAKEVRGEQRNGRLYDFILASKHPLAKKIFESVTRETAHGQLSMC